MPPNKGPATDDVNFAMLDSLFGCNYDVITFRVRKYISYGHSCQNSNRENW